MNSTASSNSPTSDEPTRVDNIVRRFFSDQSGSLLAEVPGAAVTLSIGADNKDDCAVYDLSGPVSLVFGSDYVRGPKFMLYEAGYLSNFDIGYYLVVANVSDIAAMGAIPIGLTTIIRYPKDLSDEQFEQILAGIHQAATDYGTLNVGGDIGGAERIILSASALGVCESGKALTRSGASVGDLLCVTGPVGTAGAAVAYFGNDTLCGKATPEVEKELLAAWKKPIARVAEGRVLVENGLATACQDVSDGLKATIEQLGSASGVGFIVDAEAVPFAASTEAVAGLSGVDPLGLAMSASVDFQLAFTINAASLERCRSAFTNKGLTLTVIGETTQELDVLLRRDGNVGPLPGVAWRHQEAAISTLVTDQLNRGGAKSEGSVGG